MDFPLVLITIHVFVVSNGFFFKKEREREKERGEKKTLVNRIFYLEIKPPSCFSFFFLSSWMMHHPS